MSLYTQNSLHPAPHKTALWLARVNIGLLLGGTLWLMGARVYGNKLSVNAFSSSANATRVSQPGM